ncbi:MAG: response regulator [Polyangiales bacterium]
MGSPVRTLVVDDSSSMRLLLTRVLEERDYEVVAVDSAETALKVHAERPFDLMLVDWTLPGMSGLDLCRLVRARGGVDVVILVITGRNRPEDLHAVLDAGATDYLPKPLDPELLQTRLVVAERAVQAVSLRRETQTELEANEAQFRTIIESLPDCIAVTRSDHLLYANPQLVNYLGYKSQEGLLEISLRDHVYRDDQAAAERLLRDSEPYTRGVEVRLLRANGGIVSAELSAMRFKYEGGPAKLLVIRDLSQEQEMQARLLLADRMASVGTLAAGVAHELNNPLSYVLSNLRLIREELEEPEDTNWKPRLKQSVDESIDGAERMKHIVRDLKTFSRVDDEVKGNVSIQAVMESSINMCWNEIRHRATLRKNFGETPWVQINESRLGQVFLNLLINASQSMPGDDVAANVIEVDTMTDGDGWAVVRVRDNGLGIAPANLKRIFDPFFTTKKKFEGTGLGLAICRNIINAAGGTISASSVVDESTMFEVRLPPSKIKSPPVEKKRDTVKFADGPRGRLMVIDDETLVGRSIRRALRTHEVAVFTSANEAVNKLLVDANYDVIFCDIMMPELNGMDVYEIIKDKRPELIDRFVFMTGGAFTASARKFLADSKVTCIEKPFEVAQLRELVRGRLNVGG